MRQRQLARMNVRRTTWTAWPYNRLALWILVAASLLFASLARAQSSAMPQPAEARSEDPAFDYFGDVELVNQDGQTVRLYSDLMKNKTVIINPFFATCTGVCPPMARNLEAVQNWLGDRLGADTHMISITVDPEIDTPPKLKEYARRFNARQGWHFVGGKKANVVAALRKLGQYVEIRDNHSTLIIIGNLRTGLWKKALGMSPAQGLIQVVQSVVNDKGTKQ